VIHCTFVAVWFQLNGVSVETRRGALLLWSKSMRVPKKRSLRCTMLLEHASARQHCCAHVYVALLLGDLLRYRQHGLLRGVVGISRAILAV
jgi:hypothetical protein